MPNKVANKSEADGILDVFYTFLKYNICPDMSVRKEYMENDESILVSYSILNCELSEPNLLIQIRKGMRLAKIKHYDIEMDDKVFDFASGAKSFTGTPKITIEMEIQNVG